MPVTSVPYLMSSATFCAHRSVFSRQPLGAGVALIPVIWLAPGVAPEVCAGPLIGSAFEKSSVRGCALEKSSVTPGEFPITGLPPSLSCRQTSASCRRCRGLSSSRLLAAPQRFALRRPCPRLVISGERRSQLAGASSDRLFLAA